MVTICFRHRFPLNPPKDLNLGPLVPLWTHVTTRLDHACHVVYPRAAITDGKHGTMEELHGRTERQIKLACLHLFPCVRCFGCRHGPEGRGGGISRRERLPPNVPSAGSSLRPVSPGCGVLFAAHLQPLPAEAQNQPGAERVLQYFCPPGLNWLAFF